MDMDIDIDARSTLQALDLLHNSLEVHPTEEYFINDTTFWTALRGKSGITAEEFKKDQEFHLFYMKYFTQPCQLLPSYTPSFTQLQRITSVDKSDLTSFERLNSTESCCHPIILKEDIEVIVYENQRYIPLLGWNCLHLLASERAKLSDEAGVKFPDRYLKQSKPPSGYIWKSEVMKSATEIDESDEYQRDENATVEPLLQSHTSKKNSDLYFRGLLKWNVDSTYTNTDANGWTYGVTFEKLTRHLVKGRSHDYARLHDVVRRRRWIRIGRWGGN